VLDNMASASDIVAQCYPIPMHFPPEGQNCASAYYLVPLFISKDLLLLKPWNQYLFICLPLLYLAHELSAVRRHLSILTLLLSSRTWSESLSTPIFPQLLVSKHVGQA